jgi:hypothetical protein
VRRGFWFSHETGEFRDAIFNSHLSCVVTEPVAFGVTADFIHAQFETADGEDRVGRDARHCILLAVPERSAWVRWMEITPPLDSGRWMVEAWTREPRRGYILSSASALVGRRRVRDREIPH